MASVTIVFAFVGTFVLPPFIQYLESYFTEPIRDHLDNITYDVPINIIESTYHYDFLGAFILLIILMHMLILYFKITTSSHPNPISPLVKDVIVNQPAHAYYLRIKRTVNKVSVK
jgi:Mn2+/Fe2+ NRAMP family transporter